MTDALFVRAMIERLGSASVVDLSGGGKALILSDLHMGNGSRGDDFVRNGDLVMDMLEKRYLAGGWDLVLNGDVEDLQRFSAASIRNRWLAMYRIFDRFAEKGKLHKIVGNHDEDLVIEDEYPYHLHDAIRIETGVLPIFVYHGHQASHIYSNYNRFIRASLRYVLTPIGIKNISAARNPRRRFHVERRAYDFSRMQGIVSVIGHTHRVLFESLGRFDYIKFEIERLCRDYPLAKPEERSAIEGEVRALRLELAKLKRKERRSSLQETLYGDELPVPCLFNSGCAISKKGATALEIENGSISLVYWFTEGQGKKFVGRGGYVVEPLEGTDRRFVTLNSDRLDYVKARIELLA
jgi:predicted phosphodiesterase